MTSADAKSKTDANQTSKTSPRSTQWLVCSGNQSHSTFDRSVFSSYTSIESKNKNLKVANGQLVKILGVGDVCLKTRQGTNLILKKVRHAPGLTGNYMSVAFLEKDGFSSHFVNGKYRLTKGLFNVDESEKVRDQYFVHGFLGEYFFTPLEKVASVNSGYLKLVHMAVRGPFEHPSLNGSMFFVIFVDDYSRKIWCYPMKSKSELVQVFKKFRSDAEGDSGKKIRTVFHDQAGYQGKKLALKWYCLLRLIFYECPSLGTPVNNLAVSTSDNVINGIHKKLEDAKLPWSYWEFGLSSMVNELNEKLSLKNSVNVK